MESARRESYISGEEAEAVVAAAVVAEEAEVAEVLDDMKKRLLSVLFLRTSSVMIST